jgi:hypothetical protein
MELTDFETTLLQLLRDRDRWLAVEVYRPPDGSEGWEIALRLAEPDPDRGGG